MSLKLVKDIPKSNLKSVEPGLINNNDFVDLGIKMTKRVLSLFNYYYDVKSIKMVSEKFNITPGVVRNYKCKYKWDLVINKFEEDRMERDVCIFDKETNELKFNGKERKNNISIKKKDKLIMGRNARKIFWSKMARTAKRDSDKLKASELLAKSECDFINKTELSGNDGEPININDVSDDLKERILKNISIVK